MKDLIRFKFVFLQHGVIKDSLADWLNKPNKNIDLFVTSAPRELQSILDDEYGYEENQLILTGLPRWDAYRQEADQDSKKVIYLMPTWRQYLAPGYRWNAPTISATNLISSEFANSTYYRFFQSLLSDARLHELLERYDYILKFAPHPRTAGAPFFGSDRVEVLQPESFAYSDAFKEMGLLITDYSSVSFNMAIMHKPVIYCQFDHEEFYSNHTGKKSYYSYESDGFGPIAYSKESLIDLIERYLENGLRIEEQYEKRIEEFFFWPPSGKSRAGLVLEAIMERDQNR